VTGARLDRNAVVCTAGELTVRLLEALEDLDDVRDVYSNVEISDEVLARIDTVAFAAGNRRTGQCPRRALLCRRRPQGAAQR